MEWLTDVADVKLQVDGNSFPNEQFHQRLHLQTISGEALFAPDHMQQGVHGTAQSSFTYKDKRSHRGWYTRPR